MLVFKKKIIFSNFNTCNVKDMSGMFNECFSLKELNLSNFDTRKTIFMTGIFAGCSSLKLYFEF
jgi:surface protein